MSNKYSFKTNKTAIDVQKLVKDNEDRDFFIVTIDKENFLFFKTFFASSVYFLKEINNCILVKSSTTYVHSEKNFRNVYATTFNLNFCIVKLRTEECKETIAQKLKQIIAKLRANEVKLKAESLKSIVNDIASDAAKIKGIDDEIVRHKDLNKEVASRYNVCNVNYYTKSFCVQEITYYQNHIKKLEALKQEILNSNNIKVVVRSYSQNSSYTEPSGAKQPKKRTKIEDYRKMCLLNGKLDEVARCNKLIGNCLDLNLKTGELFIKPFPTKVEVKSEEPKVEEKGEEPKVEIDELKANNEELQTKLKTLMYIVDHLYNGHSGKFINSLTLGKNVYCLIPNE